MAETPCAASHASPSFIACTCSMTFSIAAAVTAAATDRAAAPASGLAAANYDTAED